MEKIIDIIMKKEFYGTVITIGIGYIVYLLIINILHTIINKGKDEFEKREMLLY